MRTTDEIMFQIAIEKVAQLSDPYDDPNWGDKSPGSEKVTTSSFAAPFNSEFGSSSVDLSMPQNEQAMMDEYNEWLHLGRDR